MNKYRIVSFAVMTVTLILAVVSFILLPDMVTSQITSSGSVGNMLPKPAAVLMPTVICMGGAIGIFYSEKKDKWDWKSIVLCGLGLFVFVFMFIFNLK